MKLRLACCAFAVVACPLSAKEAGPPPIRLAGAEAAVVDTAGREQFRVKPGDPAFARIGNPAAVIFDRDGSLRRVRVSGFGREPLWIACRDLADTPGYCSRGEDDARVADEARERAAREAEGAEEQKARTGATRGFSYRRAAEEAAAAEAEQRAPGSAPPMMSGPDERGVPVCPGDPRCP